MPQLVEIRLGDQAPVLLNLGTIAFIRFNPEYGQWGASIEIHYPGNAVLTLLGTQEEFLQQIPAEFQVPV